MVLNSTADGTVGRGSGQTEGWADVGTRPDDRPSPALTLLVVVVVVVACSALHGWPWSIVHLLRCERAAHLRIAVFDALHVLGCLR